VMVLDVHSKVVAVLRNVTRRSVSCGMKAVVRLCTSPETLGLSMRHSVRKEARRTELTALSCKKFDFFY